MPRTKSSASWLSRHLSDPFVKQAQRDGYRSRSAYKLIELNDKDKLIRPGMRIMDLGSAPGGWSQVAGKLVGEKGRVLATDILPMDELKNVDFIQGDFTDEAIVQQVLDWLARLEIRSDHFRHRAEHQRNRFGRSGAINLFPGAGARHGVQDLEARCDLRRQDVSRLGVGSVPEGPADTLREGAHPQARGLAQRIARGLSGGEGIQRMNDVRRRRELDFRKSWSTLDPAS